MPLGTTKWTGEKSYAFPLSQKTFDEAMAVEIPPPFWYPWMTVPPGRVTKRTCISKNTVRLGHNKFYLASPERVHSLKEEILGNLFLLAHLHCSK